MPEIRNTDFIASMEEDCVAVIRRLEDKDGEQYSHVFAEVLTNAVQRELKKRIRTSYGTLATSLREVSRSYKEARMALDVAEIFYADENVIAYEELGIGRLIYQLPIPLCEMFIKEVFGDYDPSTLDEEILTTVYQFMEKLQKTIGLDIRQFEDAMTFKIAMMVFDYMKYLREKRE